MGLLGAGPGTVGPYRTMRMSNSLIFSANDSGEREGLTPRPDPSILRDPLCSSVAQRQSIRLLTGGL